VLTAIKNKLSGRPSEQRPFLTAAARAGSSNLWAGGGRIDISQTEQKDAKRTPVTDAAETCPTFFNSQCT
jgi:hypothetical protein